MIITFSIDGAYIFKETGSSDFGNCVTIPVNAGGAGDAYVDYVIPANYVAPNYTGQTVLVVLARMSQPVLNISYTILSTDTTPAILMQNIVNYINSLSIADITANYTGGLINIQCSDDTFTSTAMTICSTAYTQLMWSTCALWKCIQRLINKIFCCKRNKCEEHTKEMQKERNELNRIMLLYSQFSMMNDDERWDYLPLNLNTNIKNDLFDKLNIITARCGHCCKEYKHKHHHRHNDNDNGCNECNPQSVTDWCQKLPTEAISITGPAISTEG